MLSLHHSGLLAAETRPVVTCAAHLFPFVKSVIPCIAFVTLIVAIKVSAYV